MIERISESAGRLYRSPAPNVGEVVQMQKLGIKTILSLDLSSGNLVRADIIKNKLQNKIRHLFYPINIGSPTSDCQRVVSVIRKLNQDYYPMVIHCRAGRDRTGFATAVWLREKMSYSPVKALEVVKSRYGYGTGGASPESIKVMNIVLGVTEEKVKQEVKEDIKEVVEDILTASDQVFGDFGHRNSNKSFYTFDVDRVSAPQVIQPSWTHLDQPASGGSGILGSKIVSARDKRKKLLKKYLKKIKEDENKADTDGIAGLNGLTDKSTGIPSYTQNMNNSGLSQQTTGAGMNIVGPNGIPNS